MSEPGREAWLCPGCGFLSGLVGEDNSLIIWRYPTGFVSIRWGEFACACGYVHRWNEAKRASRVLDSGSVAVV